MVLHVGSVYAFEFGKWDFRQWADQTEEKVEEFWKYFEQLVRRQRKDAGMNNGAGVVQVTDWEGFTLSRHASPKGESFS